ncbi:MAG: hypothetical protein HYU81_02710 [Candidatus Brennerbacteria bacterium]|nr:hypothetical protein [Candidatus Brennerbacteria bacterium]
MKNLLRNPFAYLSVALAALLAFQVYGIVSAQTNYQGPTAAPTDGMPPKPLNEGPLLQTKTGALTIGGAPKLILTSTGQIHFTDSTGVAKEGIRYNQTTGKLQFSTKGIFNVDPDWKDFSTGTETAGVSSDLLWKKTDPTISAIPGANIFYQDGAVFIGEYPKAVNVSGQLYFPRYSASATNTTQEGIDFGSYNFSWETNSVTVNALALDKRLACDTNVSSVRDCFGSASLQSGSASTPDTRYNTSVSQGGFAQGPYAQIYDKADGGGYQYVFEGEAVRTSAHRPRLWCDGNAGGKSFTSLSNDGVECPDVIPAPPPGKAGGWPSVAYDYVYKEPCQGNLSGQYSCTEKVRIYKRKAVSGVASTQYARLNPNGSAEFASGKVSINPQGTITIIDREKGSVIGMGGDTGSLTLSGNIYLGGDLQVGGLKAMQVVGVCESDAESGCLAGRTVGGINNDGTCKGGGRAFGTKGGLLFCFD